MSETTPTPAPEASTPCPNCGAPLQGAYCHSCGQPKKGMIRPLSGIMADVVDSVFNIDSRILRTVGPLLFRPGRLTNDYFAGRRTRYVTPFRLFVFMTVVAFFTVQWYLDQGTPGTWKLNVEDTAIDQAATQDAVTRELAKQLAELETAQRELEEQLKAGGPGAVGIQAGIAGIEAGKAELRKRAGVRSDWIRRADEAKAQNLPLPPFLSGAIGDRDEGGGDLTFNGKPWDAKSNPVKIDWLPDAGNAKLNELAGNARENLRAGIKDPKRLVARVLDVLPQTLFVMMPLFAVLLKIFYIFKRRMYMEHLIVALHSHAFISFSLLIISLLGLIKSWLPSFVPVAGWLMACLGAWMPIYLFLMQKRVYKQGWFMTTLKFGMIGTCYTVLISFAVAAAALASLAIKS